MTLINKFHVVFLLRKSTNTTRCYSIHSKTHENVKHYSNMCNTDECFDRFISTNVKSVFVSHRIMVAKVCYCIMAGLLM